MEAYDHENIPHLLEIVRQMRENQGIDPNIFIKETDVDLIIEQTNCSRADAITSLTRNQGDIVNTIMDIQF